MSGLRAAREAAYWAHWRKSLRENPRDGLPAFLDELEAIDRAQVPGGIIPAAMTDEEAAAFAEKWLAANPAIGVRVRPEALAPADVPPPDPDEPRPVRRRAPRKAGGT